MRASEVERPQMKEIQITPEGTSIKTPNFLVIGAAKSGTTALWHCLRQHPQIYMSPRKHTRFFAYEVEDPDFSGPGPKNPSVPYAVANIDSYHALFGEATNETAIGEASHSYLYGHSAASLIHEYSSDMKLIAILRNPTERAFSHYRQMIRDGREPIDDFVRALEEEETRIRDNWWPDFHYAQIGQYHAQLTRYFDLFERDQIAVYLYEDFVSAPQRVLSGIFRFLDVDDSFIPEAELKYNASGTPKSKVIHTMLQKMRVFRPTAERILSEKQASRLLRLGSSLHNRNLNRSYLSPEVRKKLTEEYFRTDILKLQNLILRDLSAWLK